MEGYTRFSKLAADEFKGLLNGLLKATSITKNANYTLADNEKTTYIGITLSAGSKTVTLGLPDGTAAIVVNEGSTNAFTLKNVSGDSGTSVAAGKAYLVRSSSTANGSKVTLLNDGT
jgi:hypothetical protein